MTKFNGDQDTRATSEDYLSWQFYNNFTLVDLSLATKIELVLKSIKGGNDKTFSTADATPQLFIVDADQVEGADEGKVLQLRPSATDFPSVAEYKVYAWYYDGTRKYSFPRGRKYTLTVYGL